MADVNSRLKKRPCEPQTAVGPGVKRPKYEGQQIVMNSMKGMKQVRFDNRGPPPKVPNSVSLSSTSTSSPLSQSPLPATSRPAVTTSTLTQSTQAEMTWLMQSSDALPSSDDHGQGSPLPTRGPSDGNSHSKVKVRTKRPNFIPHNYYHSSGESSISASARLPPVPVVPSSFQEEANMSSLKDQLMRIRTSSYDSMVAEEQKGGKCEDVHLSDVQWRALSALHRSLIQEAHDFTEGGCTNYSSKVVQAIASQCRIPARTWRHGLLTTLQLLLTRSSDSLDHMASFVYIVEAMAKIQSKISPEQGDWLECLGDIARYRMAIEKADQENTCIFARIVRKWLAEAKAKEEARGKYGRSTTIRYNIQVLLRRDDIVERIRKSVSHNNMDFHLGGFRNSMDGITEACSGRKPDPRKELQSSILFKHLARASLHHTEMDRIDGLSSQVSFVTCIAGECVAHLPARYMTPAEDCQYDSEFNVVNLFTTLDDHQSFLLASRHPLAPTALRGLAQKYQMPKYMWYTGLNELMRKVAADGTAQDMLYWLQFGYDYIRTLRKIAPDLELDWTECQRGLDFYRSELEKCSLYDQSTSSNTNLPSEMSSLYFPNEAEMNQLESHGMFWNTLDDIGESMDLGPKSNTEVFTGICPSDDDMGDDFDLAIGNMFDSDFGSLLSSKIMVEPAAKTDIQQQNTAPHLFSHDPRPDQPERCQVLMSSQSNEIHHRNSFFNQEPTGKAAMTTEHTDCRDEDRISKARQRLTQLRSEELSKLRSLVLQCWDFIGQDFDFNIYTKIHGILSRCGLKLEDDTGVEF